MTQRALKRLNWIALLAVVPACADDGTSVTSASDTDTSSTGSTGDTIEPSTTADSSGSTSTSTTMTSADSSESSSETSSSSADTGSSDSGTSPGSSGSETTGGPTCGDDVAEGDEVCDGDDLADETCETQGFPGGTLTCLADCSGFDTDACDPVPVCGNDLIEDGEACDNADLAGESCTSQGFDAGELACAKDCTLDLSGCFDFSCGDGSINGKDECDGNVLPDDVDCGSGGFGVGTIACTDNCLIDFSGCCGDGTIAASEVCEPTDLAGQTCATVGNFDDGVLACAATCDGFDTSSCTLCGDDQAEGNESCDGDDLQGADCTTVPGGFAGGTLACDALCGYDTSGCNFCGNGMVDMGEDCDGNPVAGTCLDLGYTGGSLACQAACTFDESACTNIALPGAGELVITEVMQNPTAIDDANGEWFELHNPGLESFQLRNCTVIGGAMNESFTIDTDLVIDGGDYLTFATEADPGFTPDYVWAGNFSLNNATDTVRIECAGVLVDEVIYDDGVTFPDPAGATMQLEPTTTDAVANDDGGNWCAGGLVFGLGDLGTPGAGNTSCLPPEYTVDFCRLQFPTSILDIGGASVDIYGRVFIAGLTDLSGVNDPAVNVQMQAGYGPDGTDPSVDLTWVWTANGAPNAAYGPASPSYEANNDEYFASMTLPVPGTYDFAVRFTGDGGATYQYCDGNLAGSSDGYLAADAGQMTTLPSGDPAGLYFSEYYEGTGLNKGLEIYNPDVDDVNLSVCEVRIYFNGGAAVGRTIPLVGLVGADEAFLLCDDNLALAQCSQTVPVIDFNGDDAVELACDTDLDAGTPMVTIDVIGQIGFDPGNFWGPVDLTAPPADTLNSAMRRNCAVTQGDANGADAFDPTIEWTDAEVSVGFPNQGDLGVYVCP